MAEALIADLRPIQQRYAELRAEDNALAAVLSQGAEDAISTAGHTLRRVQDAVGLVSSRREL